MFVVRCAPDRGATEGRPIDQFFRRRRPAGFMAEVAAHSVSAMMEYGRVTLVAALATVRKRPLRRPLR